MKQGFKLLLVMVMVLGVFTLTGCGSKKEDNTVKISYTHSLILGTITKHLMKVN